jgi:hypothetical protein
MRQLESEISDHRTRFLENPSDLERARAHWSALAQVAGCVAEAIKRCSQK